MNEEWTNEMVRELADREYVQPARKSYAVVRIQQGELYDKARRLGLPQNHANAVGSAVESPKFWAERGLEMLTPSRQSRARSTIYEFRFQNAPPQPAESERAGESPSERAFRLTERVRGLLKDEIAAFGGAEAFMRWVRSDEEDVA